MVFSSIDVGTYPCESKAPNSSTSSSTDVCGRWLYIPESSAATGISFVPSSLVLRSWWPQILKEEQKNHNNYKGTTQINNLLVHESACLCRDMTQTGTLESTKGNSSLLSALQTFQVHHNYLDICTAEAWINWFITFSMESMHLSS